MKKQILLPIFIFIILFLVTLIIILYGKGYRIGQLQNGKPTISKTGLLVATSSPDGAQVFINGSLTTATDNTIDLLPGNYDVRIEKDGYLPWEKTVQIQKEVVTKADATLFPTAPRLENITSIGVENPVIDPSEKRIAFRVASQSAKKNGIYVLDMASNPILTLQSSAKQLSDDITAQFSFSNYRWSPNGEDLMANVSNGQSTPDYYLIHSNGFNDTPQNITAILPTIEDQWTAQKTEKDLAQVNSLPVGVRKLLHNNFSVIAWSPDDDKILYVASQSATLPIIIKPRHIGIDSLREIRTITKNDIYVYDIKDDVNMKVMNAQDADCMEPNTCKPPIQWFPDSNHLIVVKDKKINIMESDGTNSTTVYAGPFIDHFVFPWPSGTKIVILTNFNNPGVPANLYTISLQ